MGFLLNGNLTCEVTTENPGMVMSQSTALMTVVGEYNREYRQPPPRAATPFTNQVVCVLGTLLGACLQADTDGCSCVLSECTPTGCLLNCVTAYRPKHTL